MIHEIKIYNPDGVLKEVVSSKEATKVFWGTTAELSMTHKKALTPDKELNCIACNTKFTTNNYKKAYCTVSCMHKQAKIRAKIRYANKTLATDNRAYTAPDGSIRFKIVCMICEKAVERKSSSAVTCSEACRYIRRKQLNKQDYARFKQKQKQARKLDTSVSQL